MSIFKTSLSANSQSQSRASAHWGVRNPGYGIGEYSHIIVAIHLHKVLDSVEWGK